MVSIISLAEIVLAQNELDQMGAHREDAEPEPAACAISEPRRISRHVADDRLRRRDAGAGNRGAADPVPPAFGKPKRLAIGRNGNPVRIIQVTQQARRVVEPRPASDQTAEMALLHEIANPILALVPTAAVGHEDVAVGRGDNAGEALQRLVFDLIEPGLPAAGIDRGQTAAGDADQQAPVGVKCQTLLPRRRTRRRWSASRSRHRPDATPACPRRHRSRRRHLRRYRRHPEAALRSG